MNVLGAVGSITGSRVAEALQVSVPHMLSAHRVATAVRGHILESALNVKFVTQDPQDDEVTVDRWSTADVTTCSKTVKVVLARFVMMRTCHTV